ncbi:chitosanase [Paenibacillus guangzhouensis]|uniref:chitosanase n=1 Tax=Paenibacillus guangzhouensis TaxID=1473112 RepID=UPI001266ED1C|nr:chitosanase [Paenibacillus guangzhouensis]
MNRMLTTAMIVMLMTGCTAYTTPKEAPSKVKIYSDASISATLSSAQKLRAEKLISLFENGVTTIQYGYAKNLHDGRGFTCGRAGFTTGTGDAYEVINRYTKRVPSNKLASYLPELKRLNSARNKADVSRLAGFDRAWKSLGRDATFRAVQDEVVDEWYYRPSASYASTAGLKLPLSMAVLYDTIIQHGGGSDPDSLSALIKRTNAAVGGTPRQGVDEKIWLAKFLDVRRADLKNPSNRSTQQEWAQSVGRVDVFKSIAASNNYNLNAPIVIHTSEYHETIV